MRTKREIESRIIDLKKEYYGVTGRHVSRARGTWIKSEISAAKYELEALNNGKNGL